MIFSNLKVLLAQRNITISKMSSDTNISRTTLTALCSNKSGGIQFDTLDTICSYLNILPHELILFSPYSLTPTRNKETLFINVVNLTNNKTFTLELFLEIERYNSEKFSDSVYFNHYESQEKLFVEFNKIISELPKYYLSYLNSQIAAMFSDVYTEIATAFSFNLETSIY